MEHEGVVAETAGHGVGARAAIQKIVAAVAEERVHPAVTVAMQLGAALQDHVLAIVRQPQVDGGEYGVVTLAGVLDRLISDVVDEIDVVAETAEHRVGARAAIQKIVAAVAEERVHPAVAVALQPGAALQDQVLDTVRQPEVDGGEYGVVTLAGVLERLIALFFTKLMSLASTPVIAIAAA